MIGAGVERADDYLELQVGIVLIQTSLKILRRRVVGKQHGAPFDVEDTVRRCARDRGEHTAVSTGEACAAAQTEIGAHILPHREDGEVIRPDVWRRRQTVCNEAARLIRHHEVEASVRAYVHAGEGLVIQREWEGQRDWRVYVVTVITRIGVARHDRIGAIGYGVLRATRRRGNCWRRGWCPRRSGRWTDCRCGSNGRCRCRSSCRCNRRCWCGGRRWNASRRLDDNTNWRAGLKEAYGCIRRIRALIGIEPEVVHSSKANCIGVLILRKGFAVPNNGGVSLLIIVAPRCAAVPGISLGAIMRETRMLRRHVKSNVTDVDPRSQGHAERLNGPIEVLVIQGVLIVPDASIWSCHLVTHEPDTIVAVIWFDLIYCRASPGRNRWVLSIGAAYGTKTKGLIDSGYGVLFVRSVIILVALVRMTLAPRAFVWDDVFRFGKIGRPHV